MLNFGVPPWELVLRSGVIYLVLLTALRLFGKREIGQFRIHDLVLILLVANAVQPAMTGPDTSLAGGVVIIVSLVVLNLLVGQLDRLGLFHRMFQSEPTVIVENGQFQAGNMRREGIDRDEVETAIREHGLADVSEVQIGVLEPDGSISIVGRDVAVQRTQRRVRYRPRG